MKQSPTELNFSPTLEMVTVPSSRDTVIPIEFRNILRWRAIPQVGQPFSFKDEKNSIRNFLLTKNGHLISPSVNKHVLLVRPGL